MSSVRRNVNKAPIEDTVFAIAKKAKKARAAIGAEQVADATTGFLYNEEGNIVAFDSVLTPYNEVAEEIKTTYMASFVGNDFFRKQIYEWTVGGTGSAPVHSTIATPGGTGAVATTTQEILDEGETAILPETTWGSYRLMTIVDNLKVKTYSLFEGDHLNVEPLKETCCGVMKTQKKLLPVINDPCHSPTGYSMSMEEWQKTVAFLNECGEEVPVAFLNDIAYTDFSYDLEHYRNYIKMFNDFSENVMAVITFSCSKALTSYGLRCGAAILLAQTKEAIHDMEIVFEKAARATWSNVPNTAIENFTYATTTNYDAYMKEKVVYVELLKKRSDIFTEEADACGLDYYPYKEGFFVTMRIEDNVLHDVSRESLMKQHIHTVKVNKGTRIVVCSLSSEKCRELVKRMREIPNICKQAHITPA